MNMGWIDVKDKLPEIGQNVLLISHGWDNYQNGIYIGALQKVESDKASNRKFWIMKTLGSDWTICEYSFFHAPNVTHWMPIPPLP